jgi:hypothetical protein
LITCLAGAQEVKVEGVARLAEFNRMNEDVEIFRRILNHKLDLPRVSTFPAPANPNLLNQPSGGLLGISGGGMGALGGNLGGMGISGGALGLAGGQGFGGGTSPINTLNGNGLNPILTTSRSSLDYPAAEGVYLKGYGVVYNLVLPPQPKPHAKENAQPAKPISEWDRIRKELHGEKVTEESKPNHPKVPTLTETLIKLLAENGHRFAQLGEKENITIAITFREHRPAASSGPLSLSIDYGFTLQSESGNFLYGVGVNSDQGLTGSVSSDPGSPIGTQASFQRPNTGSITIDAAGGEEKGPYVAQPFADSEETGNKPTPSPAKDLLLLADLNFKQSKFAEAEALYRKALEALAAEKDNAKRADILRKLAQILVAEGKFDEAKKLLEQILEKKGQEVIKSVQKEAPKPLALPAQLIITASKELLDQVATKKIDFEAFSKAVTVQHESVAAGEK